MANRFFNSFKNNLLDVGAAGAIDFNTDIIKVALIDEGVYAYSAAHDFLNDVTGIVGTAQTITTPTVGTVGAGVFDGDNVTFTGVSGASVEALLLYKDTGTAATSALIGLIDQVAGGLPVTPNSGDIIITWNASGILSIA
jgi:hypothetical protein